MTAVTEIQLLKLNSHIILQLKSHSLSSSIKMNKSPDCSVNISGCASSHIKVTNSDCSVIHVSAHSSSSISESPPNACAPVSLTCLSGNASKSKDNATKVQLVNLTKVELADTSSVKSNDVVLMVSHCKQTSL